MKSFRFISLFPEMLENFFSVGVIFQARKKGLLHFVYTNPRDHAEDKHRSVDDRPFSGGDGMVMKANVLDKSLQSFSYNPQQHRLVYLSPQGARLDVPKIRSFAEDSREVVLLCGRYSGIDERFFWEHPAEEISIGDYVLSGGEVAAAVFIESVTRFVPGVLGHSGSAENDSFSQGRLEAPQFTRPEVWKEHRVPSILLSGDHKKIEEYQKKESLRMTSLKRPDLLPTQRNKLSIALVHYPIVDRSKEIIATNITNFDIHDPARASRTYGANPYYIIHPVPEQLMFVHRILDHWKIGTGRQYNSSRRKALDAVRTAPSLEAAVDNLTELHQGRKPQVLVTHARPIEGLKTWSTASLRDYLRREDADPVLLVFGTGYGLPEDFMKQQDGVLESLHGPPPDDFRHLSVRSAISIYLDRLLSS